MQTFLNTTAKLSDMDRALFDRERVAVQDELSRQGQDIAIPDPDDPAYLSTFLALQRSYPRLATRLADAEQADPADFYDAYAPRPPKVTAKHRFNALVDRHFMRQGLDKKRVMDRQRVFRTGMYTLGAIIIGGLVWSVVAPTPSTTPELAQAAKPLGVSPKPAGQGAAPSTDTRGAFAAVNTSRGVTSSTPQGSAATTLAQGRTPAATPDAPPRPVSAFSPTPASTTPAPPPVFNEVRADPYTPTSAASPPTARAAAPHSTAPPAEVAMPEPMSPTPTYNAVAAPFGSVNDSSAPSATSAAPTPLDPSPTAEAPTPFPSPVAPGATDPVSAVGTAQQGESSPSAATSPFGGAVDTTLPTNTPSPSAASVPETPGSAMIDQSAKQQQTASPASAMLYEAPTSRTDAAVAPAGNQSALIYQRTLASGTGSAAPRSSLIYQAPAKTPVPAASEASAGPGASASPSAAQAADPDAPSFAPTSIVQGKLFSNIRTAAGLVVPVIVLTPDGNWLGVATYNTRLGRVDMQFSSFVQRKNSKAYPVQASAYQVEKNGTLSEGVSASIHPIAPTLTLDLARAGLNSFNTYTLALQNAATTTINGSLISTSQQPPSLAQVIRGEVGKVFALPEGNQSIEIVADVVAGSDIRIIYGYLRLR